MRGTKNCGGGGKALLRLSATDGQASAGQKGRGLGEIKEKAFLSYKVDIKTVDKNAKDFDDLSIEDQKRFLLECLDKNHLYVNYSELDDEEYGVSREDKKVNKEFYGG